MTISLDRAEGYWENKLYNDNDAALADGSTIAEHQSFLTEIQYALESLRDAIKDYNKSEFKGKLFTSFYESEFDEAIDECERAIDELERGEHL